MPTIRISSHNWERMKRFAEPLEDKPDDVLDKILTLAEAQEGRLHGGPKGPEPAAGKMQVEPKKPRPVRKKSARRRFGERLPAGQLLPMKEYTHPILTTIYESGGTAPTRHVLEGVERKLKDRLTEIEREVTNNHQARWRSRAQWQRKHLVDDGLLKKDSPHGVWELTPAGVAWVEQHLGGLSAPSVR